MKDNQQHPRKIKSINVGNIAYKVVNGFTERINNEIGRFNQR